MKGIFFKIIVFCIVALHTNAQNLRQPKSATQKKISPDLFGIFFEDLNYAADGGLYAELIQNRSFEYSPGDRTDWNHFTAWEFFINRDAIANISIESVNPVHVNNPHYVQFKIENGSGGTGIKNAGFDGINIQQGEKYIFSIFTRQPSGNTPLEIKLTGKSNTVYATETIINLKNEWTKQSVVLTASQTDTSAVLTITAKGKGVLQMDMISLFPEKTFHNRNNGLRADLAQTIADLKPKFMRFPGGCLVHGNGVENIYNWKNSIGPVETRVAQPNIWKYHQSLGLGYFEYFQFCEDIGAKPLPVVAAGVSCQNSGHTKGTGQACVPIADMQQYVQDVLDLIEYANGSVTSTWGSKRAASGHAAPFNLTYIGVGNEDKITAEFEERFKLIYDAVKLKHPEITVIGTVGPAPDGEDFDKGNLFARKLNVPFVDEHYYMKPEWFIANQHRYDNYKLNEPLVYLGEYASRGNTWFNAVAEAAFMTSLERNGDVVRLASYAPLLAKEGHTQWNPDLIYFNNRQVTPTVNYYVQQFFSLNQGDIYYDKVISFVNPGDSTLAASCVSDTKTGDIILKLVNATKVSAEAAINLKRFKNNFSDAIVKTLSGLPDAKNDFKNPQNVVPVISSMHPAKMFKYTMPAYSLTIIRIKTKK